MSTNQMELRASLEKLEPIIKVREHCLSKILFWTLKLTQHTEQTTLYGLLVPKYSSGKKIRSTVVKEEDQAEQQTTTSI